MYPIKLLVMDADTAAVETPNCSLITGIAYPMVTMSKNAKKYPAPTITSKPYP
jgi:hypothetical protein